MSWRSEFVAQVRLALPFVAVQVGLMAMGTVDCLFLGRVSPEAFAAVTLGHTYVFTLIAFGMGTLSALDPIVSQAHGAGDSGAIARSLQRGLVLGALIAIPTMLLILPVRAVLTLFQQPPDVVPVAVDYSLISIVGVLPFLLFSAMRMTLQGMHRMGAILIVMLLANLLNVALDWMWIFGRLGFAAHGAVGSAWATSVSRWFLALALLVLAWGDLRPCLAPQPGVLRREAFGRMLRLGLPVGGQFLVEVGAFAAASILMGSMGAVVLAGHQVALNLSSLSFMVPLGISMASSVRVGHAVGRADLPGMRLAAKVSLFVGGGVMSFFGALFLLAPGPLARLFTDLEDVLVVAAGLIPLAGIFQVFDGIQVVAIGVLRGTADTRVPMWIQILGLWGVGIPAAAFFAFGLDHGPAGLWWGLVLGLAAVAVIQVLRVRHHLAGDVRRLLIDEDLGSDPST